MSAIGQFPNMRENMRRTVRGPVNPIDKSTVVSIYPRPINIRNVTISPGKFYLEPGSLEKPSILIIGPSSWWRDVNIDEPLIEIVQSSVQIAESIVKDYLNGVFACDMDNAMPGLFFIPGKINIQQLTTTYEELLQQANQRQLNYYSSLIKFGDALWARSNGNPMAIGDEMRLAARMLGKEDREWMKDHVNTGLVRCFACGEFKHPEFPICRTCHTVDPNHPKASMVQRVNPNPEPAENPFENKSKES